MFKRKLMRIPDGYQTSNKISWHDIVRRHSNIGASHQWPTVIFVSTDIDSSTLQSRIAIQIGSGSTVVSASINAGRIGREVVIEGISSNEKWIDIDVSNSWVSSLNERIGDSRTILVKIEFTRSVIPKNTIGD